MTELKCNKEIYDLFFKTMFERHQIWYKRFVLKEQHLTDDEIFQKYKFTNVYRELDKNTQWQIQNVFMDESLDLRQMIFKLFVFRLVNNIVTFNEAERMYGWKNGLPKIGEYTSEKFYELLESLHKNGITPFTSAYLVYNGKGCTRHEFFSNVVFPAIIDNIDGIINTCKNAKSAREILDYLTTFEGIGRFNAYQLYIDLTYIDTFSHMHLFDFKKDSDINIGPGSTTGAKLIYPDAKPKDVLNIFNHLASVAEEELTKIANETNSEPYKYLKFDKNGFHLTNECTITITEIEHWLCEFQKYYGCYTHTGKSRTKFVPAENQKYIDITEENQKYTGVTEENNLTDENNLTEEQQSKVSAFVEEIIKRYNPNNPY